MSRTGQFQARSIAPGAWLEIDGFPWLFYMGKSAPTAFGALNGRAFTPGLIDFSGTSAGLDLLTGLPLPGRLSVRVAPGRDGRAAGLLRLAPTGGGASSTLAVTLPGTLAAASVVCNDSIAAFTSAGVLYIGQEAFAYVAKDNGTRTFTVPLGGRAALGSQYAKHVASAEQGWAPRVYQNCCTWQRRPARLWVYTRRTDGASVDQPICEIDGWISGPPQIQGDGTIEVQLESLSAVLDKTVGGAEDAETQLQHGWHAFDGEVGDRFDTITQVYREGAALTAPASAAVAAGAGAIPIAWGMLDQVFDVGGGTTGPLSGSIIGANNEVIIPNAASTGNPWDGTGQINLDAAEPTNAIADGQIIRSSRAEVRQSVSVLTAPNTAEVVQWPGGGLDVLNATMGLDKSSAAGSFAPTFIDAAGTIAITPTVATGLFSPLLIRWLAPTQRTCWGVCIGGSLPALLGGQVAHDWPAYNPAGRGQSNRQTPEGAPFAAEFSVEPNTGPVGAPSEPAVWSIGGVASAWYQPGSVYMHAEGDIFGSPGPGRPTPILAVTQWRGDEVRVLRRVTSTRTAASITAGTPGTLAVIDPRDRGGLPLADLPGQPRTTLRAVPAFINAAPTDCMLQLLFSVSGNAVNGVYDRLPFGAGLRSAQVDTASFLAFGSGGLAVRSFLIEEGEALGDILSDLARSIGAVIVESLSQDTGRRRIALRPAGLPSAMDAVATIRTQDWLPNARPMSRLTSARINAIEFIASWQDGIAFGAALSDASEFTVRVTDRDSAGEAGDVSSSTMRLLGLRLDTSSIEAQRAVVIPTAAANFAAFGYDRREVVGTVPYQVGALIDPGAVIILQGAEVLGYDGRPVPSAGIAGRVTSVDRTILGDTATITAQCWETNTTGWAPALRVTGAPSATSVTVEPNFYAPAEAATGAAQTDASLFAVGNAVLCIPRGNYAAATARAITIIAGNTVTFDGAHGLAAGDSVRSQDYAAAGAGQRTYAYLADAATLLLNATDPAQRYT